MPSVRNYEVLGRNVIFGLEELREKFEQIHEELATDVLKEGLKEGAGVIRDDAKRRVRQNSHRFGALEEAIVVESRGLVRRVGGRREIVGQRATVTIAVKAFRYSEGLGELYLMKYSAGKNKKAPRYLKGDIYPRNYAHLVEFGVRPHYQPKRKRMHPGFAPEPFIRPAYDEKKDEAVRVFVVVVRVGLDKAIAKAAANKRKAG